MRIMLLDNDRPFLRSMELLLTGLGHTVQTFSDVASACIFLEQGGVPHVLFLDFAMPLSNGLDFLDRAEGNLPSTCRVVLLTGHLDRVAADTRWRHPRVDEVLFKPVGGKELLEALERAAADGARSACHPAGT